MPAKKKTPNPQSDAERDAEEHARSQAEAEARQSGFKQDRAEPEPMNPVRGRDEYEGGTGNPDPHSGEKQTPPVAGTR